MADREKFSHRYNSDGTVDSICRECFRTVASGQNESQLLIEERAHICEPGILAWYHETNELNTA